MIVLSRRGRFFRPTPVTDASGDAHANNGSEHVTSIEDLAADTGWSDPQPDPL